MASEGLQQPPRGLTCCGHCPGHHGNGLGVKAPQFGRRLTAELLKQHRVIDSCPGERPSRHGQALRRELMEPRDALSAEGCKQRLRAVLLEISSGKCPGQGRHLLGIELREHSGGVDHHGCEKGLGIMADLSKRPRGPADEARASQGAGEREGGCREEGEG